MDNDPPPEPPVTVVDGTDFHDENQCRICLDGSGAEEELGRLIRPCLCRGSISYVHIKCLQEWRRVSAAQGAFFRCQQCHYEYRFARTKIVGIATNPVIVGGLSALLFTVITFASSYFTTTFMSLLRDPTYYPDNFYFGYVSPFDTARELIRASLKIMQDEDVAQILDQAFSAKPANSASATSGDTTAEASPIAIWIRNFISRFLLGLPLVGASSLVQMALSFPLLAPVQWLARYRGSARRRNGGNSKDLSAFIIAFLIIAGSARALWQVYRFTRSMSRRLLVRVEDAILEVD